MKRVRFVGIVVSIISTATFAQHIPDVPHKGASLPCGTMNPHIQYMVTADTGTDKSGALDRIDSITAGTPLTQNTGDGWPYNGHGAATATVQTICTLIFPGDESNVYTKLNISTAILAKDGCCGGLQPGGQAYAEPEWQSSLILPGSDDSRWKLKVTLNTSESADDPDHAPTLKGKCTFAVDGDKTGRDLDWTQPVASFTTPIGAGPHALTFQCPQFGDNYRGQGQVAQRDTTVEQTLYLSASRDQDRSGQQKK